MNEQLPTLPRTGNAVRPPARSREHINLRTLEEEVSEVVRRPPPAREDGIPMLDAHNPDLGKLSAQAVMTQYEHTAEQVEKLGDMVKALMPQLDASQTELLHDLKTIEEAAKQIRNKGEHTKLLIETASNLSKAIRDACDDFTKKMG
jgi:hypothetical protein